MPPLSRAVSQRTLDEVAVPGMHAVEHPERAGSPREHAAVERFVNPTDLRHVKPPFGTHSAADSGAPSRSYSYKPTSSVACDQGHQLPVARKLAALPHARGAGAQLGVGRRAPTLEQRDARGVQRRAVGHRPPDAPRRRKAMRRPSIRTGSSAALLMQARQGSPALTHSSRRQAGPRGVRSSAATCAGTAERHPYVAGERADVGALRHVEGHVPRPPAPSHRRRRTVPLRPARATKRASYTSMSRGARSMMRALARGVARLSARPP